MRTRNFTYFARGPLVPATCPFITCITSLNFVEGSFFSYRLTSASIKHESCYCFGLLFVTNTKNNPRSLCFAMFCCGCLVADSPMSSMINFILVPQCPGSDPEEYVLVITRIHRELCHNHNKIKHNRTSWIFGETYSRPPAPLILTKSVYHARTHFREKWGIFSMGGPESRKWSHFRHDSSKFRKMVKFCMYLFLFLCSAFFNGYA